MGFLFALPYYVWIRGEMQIEDPAGVDSLQEAAMCMFTQYDLGGSNEIKGKMNKGNKRIIRKRKYGIKGREENYDTNY